MWGVSGLTLYHVAARQKPEALCVCHQFVDTLLKIELYAVQGAAIAAAVCATQQDIGRGAQAQERCSPEGSLRFAICCSGYPSPVQEYQQHQRGLASIGLPSLHIYGARDEDRQITALESRALAEHFDITQRYVIEHSSGHVIPSSKAVVTRIRDFLKRHAMKQPG